MKKIIIAVLCVFLLMPLFGISAFAENDNYDEDEDANYVDVGILSLTNIYTVEEMLMQSRFKYVGGHGFVAEEANNLIDGIKGINSKIIGYDNATNGADRVITRAGKTIYIQDKYWSSPSKTIRSAFDNTKGGIYKYMNSDGTPMQLEVPADQYDDVVKLMSDKIKNGKVLGVTDPDEAKNIVRKGNITYQQSVNISKAGTFDSLVYDAANGCVTATTAFGISATIDFAIRTINGESWENAIKNSAMMGLKTGGNAFAIYVITSQLSKANLTAVFEPATQALIDAMGDDFAKALIGVYGVNRATSTSAQRAAKELLANQALASVVTIVVITVPDAVDLIRGRISAKQLLKNLAITTASVVGGTAGAIVGSAAGTVVAPGVGSTIGGAAGAIIGGTAAGFGAEAVMNIFIEDDAEEMIEIIQEVFLDEAVNYLATEEEAEIVAEELSTLLTGKLLKDMFESENKEEFAVAFIQPLFEKTISNRPLINIPTSEEMRYELKKRLDGVIYIH